MGYGFMTTFLRISFFALSAALLGACGVPFVPLI